MSWWKKEQKKSYEELPIKEGTIVNYLTDALLAFDKNSKLSLINIKAEEFFRVREKEVLGMSILNLSRFPNFRPLVSFLGGGIKIVSREELEIKKDFILEVTTVPLEIKREKKGTLVILHNVSREKLVDRMKSEFVTLAAHQLRTPTSAVKWSLQILLEGDLGELNKKQKEIIGEAYETNDRAIKLVGDLLDVAQIEEGKYISKTVLIDIEGLIQSIVGDYKLRLKERELKVKLKKPGEGLPKIMIDVEKMRTAIRNIFDNAIRYTLPGGKISIVLKGNKKEIEVQIQDTGLGIPRSEQGKIFTKFFRGANVMKIDTEGTGLGLYISKNIIEAHGGMIWFDSEEGKGTTFYFTIPIREKYGEFLGEKFY